MRKTNCSCPCRLGAAVAFALCLGSGASAGPGDRSPGGLWTEITRAEAERRAGHELAEKPETAPAFELDDARLVAELGGTPSIIELPMPDGVFKRFRVEPSPILAPRVAREFPEIQTYRIQGLDEPALGGRISWMPLGFSASILTAEGLVRIERAGVGGTPSYLSFFERDRPGAGAPACGVEGDLPTPHLGDPDDPPDQAGGPAPGVVALDPKLGHQTVHPFGNPTVVLKIYELAVAVSNDFYDHAGNNDSAVMQFVVDEINALSLIYERDLAITLQVVSGSELLDIPFTNAVSCNLVSEAHNTITGIVCPNNQCSYEWDFGHLFDYPVSGTQGCAFVGVICGSGKGGGVSQWNPNNGASHALHLVAHETGHQFGAGHTQSGTTCAQVMLSSAYEPGSGSTIMSYWGLCGSQNIPNPGNIDYFHIRSIDQIRTYTQGNPGNTCDTEVVTANQLPEVTPIPDHPLTPQTEFRLTGTAQDPNDPTSQLAYTWEQYDQPAQASSPFVDNPGPDPIFRSYFPGPSPTRIFVNAGVPGSFLPTQTDVPIKMRLVVRDNNYPAGGVQYYQMRLLMQGVPFRVLYPNGGEVFHDEVVTVTWEKGGDPAPVSSVNILLSTNGGVTWTTLLANTPNDGSEDLTLVTSCPSQFVARLRIEAADGFFWDVSDGVFSLICDCPNAYDCSNGCVVDPDDCSGYQTAETACWDGAQVLYCQRRTAIGISNCDCDSMAQGGGGGGNQIIVPGCGQTQTFGCPLVPPCPAETGCGGNGHVCYLENPACTLSDTGFDECVRPDDTLLSCPVGQTVHISSCDCNEGPDCNTSQQTFFCQ